MVVFSQEVSLLSSSTRVLGTKLQERPRAGFNGPELLSLVTWLVTCSTNRLSSATRCNETLEVTRKSWPGCTF